MKVMEQAYAQMEQQLSFYVQGVVQARGVPTSVSAAHALADELYPQVMEQRRLMWAREAAALGDSFPGVMIPEPVFYPQTALEKLVRRAAGLTPDAELMQLELFDPATIALHTRSVKPFAYPGEEAVLLEMQRRLQGGVARHVKAASRDLVTETARGNGMGWARVLVGGENCPFCAMLASRGAVYSKTSVRFRTHDHCDCTATLVGNPDHWEGKEQADELRGLWEQSESKADFGRRFRKAWGYEIPA